MYFFRASSVILVAGLALYYFATNEDSTIENDEILDQFTPQTEKWVKNEEIRLFRQYLRFQTVSLNSNFGKFPLNVDNNRANKSSSL